MRITDGKTIMDIEMYEGRERNEVSRDFFDDTFLELDAEHGAYRVRDLDYCVSIANDWRLAIGDYAEDSVPDREVLINLLTPYQK